MSNKTIVSPLQLRLAVLKLRREMQSELEKLREENRALEARVFELEEQMQHLRCGSFDESH